MRLSIILLLMAGTTFGQGVNDSTRQYHNAYFKVMKLAQLAMQAKAADSLMTIQEEVINQDLKIQEACDSLLKVRRNEILNAQNESDEWKKLYENQKEQTKIAGKQKRKWVIIGIGGLALAVAEFLKGG